jgi:hypothetical protein
MIPLKHCQENLWIVKPTNLNQVKLNKYPGKRHINIFIFKRHKIIFILKTNILLIRSLKIHRTSIII